MSKKTHKYNKTKRKGNNRTKRKTKHADSTIKKIHDYANKGINFLSKINDGIHVMNNLIDPKQLESSDPPFICFISSILSRLAYNRNGILDDYLTIFHDNIINNEFLIDIKNNNINYIFNNNDFFKLSDIISSKLCIEYARKINKRLLDDTRPRTFPIGVSSKNVMYISITTSNYSSVYIIADKIMNAIWVVFKGTDSPKNMSIYSKPSSLIPIILCEGERDGIIGGIFKILSEIINTIIHSIDYLSDNFLKSKTTKIFTCGHSLGGALATIFAYLWIGLKNNKTSPYYHKDSKNSVVNKICCITFGSPRVLNGYAINKFNKFIEKGYIFYRRIANEGDPCVNLPISTTFFDSGYFHPDEYNINNNKHLVFFCNPILEKQLLNEKQIQYNKLHLCNHYKKTTDIKIQFNSMNIYAHSLYYYILYYNLLNVTNYTGEIMRYDYKMKKYSEFYGGDTMGRIIIAGGESNTRIGFYDLYEVEGRKINTDNDFVSDVMVSNDNNRDRDKDKNNKKDYYQMFIDYTTPNINIQDNYMTKKVFDYLLKNLTVYKNDVKNNTNTNINPLKGEVIFLPINQQSVFIENINCYTSQFFYKL
uniref:Fungal lipase-type domain-containing protein n=1 Tax=viral metagenome TaxID=1070528 RepID=A0A6C0EG46_9ZZZZ